MYAGRDFDPIDNNSGQIYGFDLAATLPPDTGITAAQANVILESGTDDTPASHLIGETEVSGASVTQMLFWGDPPTHFVGNKYVFYVVARTNAGEIIIPWARIAVEKGFGASAFTGAASPLAANVFVIPMPAPLFTLPSLGGYSLQDFPDIDQGERRICGLDFASLLSPGEDVVNANVSLTVITGSDPTVAQNPMAYFPSSPTFSGAVVQQLIAIPPLATLLSMVPQYPDLRGVVYAFAISARTSFGQAINAWSRLRIRSFYA
jgi:hypothetical protein